MLQRLGPTHVDTLRHSPSLHSRMDSHLLTHVNADSPKSALTQDGAVNRNSDLAKFAPQYDQLRATVSKIVPQYCRNSCRNTVSKFVPRYVQRQVCVPAYACPFRMPDGTCPLRAATDQIMRRVPAAMGNMTSRIKVSVTQPLSSLFRLSLRATSSG